MDQLIINADGPRNDDPELTWVNVGIALAFILVDGPSSRVVRRLIVVVFSIALGLGIEKSILVASARCLIQLSLMVVCVMNSIDDRALSWIVCLLHIIRS